TSGARNASPPDTLGPSHVTGGGGSIVGASPHRIDINAGTGNYSFANTITTAAAGRSVEVTNHTGGTIAFTGAISDTGLGINLDNNTGSTINFRGAITASTDIYNASSATGDGPYTD